MQLLWNYTMSVKGYRGRRRKNDGMYVCDMNAFKSVHEIAFWGNQHLIQVDMICLEIFPWQYGFISPGCQ